MFLEKAEVFLLVLWIVNIYFALHNHDVADDAGAANLVVVCLCFVACGKVADTASPVGCFK